MHSDKIKISWLKGMRVALIGNYVPAPWAASLLAGLGAEVIKIERGQGDYLRHIQTVQGQSAMFEVLNRGFKSICLEYHLPEGAALLHQLLSHCDVLLDGSRPGALGKYLDGQLPSELVHIPLTAYGLQGPMRDLAGHDNNILGLGGNLSYTDQNADGQPTVFSAPVADFMAGQMAALAAVASYAGKKAAESGPKVVDTSMLHAGFMLNLLELSSLSSMGNPQPGKSWMNGGRPDYRSYRCSDGKYILLAAMEPHLLRKLLVHLDLQEDSADLAKNLASIFLTQDQAYWTAIGEKLDVCLTPVLQLSEAVEHPQIQALGLVEKEQDEWQPGFPMGFGENSDQPQLAKNAPRLGEHSELVLSELLGFSELQIAAAKAKGLLGAV